MSATSLLHSRYLIATSMLPLLSLSFSSNYLCAYNNMFVSLEGLCAFVSWYLCLLGNLTVLALWKSCGLSIDHLSWLLAWLLSLLSLGMWPLSLFSSVHDSSFSLCAFIYILLFWTISSLFSHVGRGSCHCYVFLMIHSLSSCLHDWATVLNHSMKEEKRRQWLSVINNVSHSRLQGYCTRQALVAVFKKGLCTCLGTLFKHANSLATTRLNILSCNSWDVSGIFLMFPWHFHASHFSATPLPCPLGPVSVYILPAIQHMTIEGRH